MAVAPKPPPSDEARAMEMLRSFLNAKNVDERLLTVRDLTRNLEPLIRAYYATHPDGPIPFTQITPKRAVSKNTRIRKFEVRNAGRTKAPRHRRASRATQSPMGTTAWTGPAS